MKTSALIAQAVLTGKIANCRTVLQRALRDHSEKIDADAISQASQKLANSMRRLQVESPLDTLRGIEGESAYTYFSVFDHLITSQKDDFKFNERNRRPPLDNVNCLLSFLYTIVMHDVRSALETVGLDPAVGFLHRDRPGRYGLALDLMEEFRPFFADRLTLSLINLCQVQGKGFQKKRIWGSMDGRRYEKDCANCLSKAQAGRDRASVFKGEGFYWNPFYVQALLMARYLRGDMDNYPPFIWK